MEPESAQLQADPRTLEALIGEQPTYADAYDVMAACQVEQRRHGRGAGPTAARPDAASVSRLRKQACWPYMGERDGPPRRSERTVRIGISSKMFDCQSLVLLTFLHRQARRKTFARAIGHPSAPSKRPESTPARRLLETSRILQALVGARPPRRCRPHATSHQARDDDFDFEAAANLIAALARLAGTEIQLPDGEPGGEVATRFCASRPRPHAGAGRRAMRPTRRRCAPPTRHRRREGDDAQPERRAGCRPMRALLDLGGQTPNACSTWRAWC